MYTLSLYLKTSFSSPSPLSSALLCRFTCIPCTDKGHAMSSKMSTQISRLLKVLPTHLTDQLALPLLPPLRYVRGGRPRYRTPPWTCCIIMVTSVTRGGFRAVVAVIVGGRVSDPVGDEAVAGQGWSGGEAGPTLQALQPEASGPL